MAFQERLNLRFTIRKIILPLAIYKQVSDICVFCDRCSQNVEKDQASVREACLASRIILHLCAADREEQVEYYQHEYESHDCIKIRKVACDNSFFHFLAVRYYDCDCDITFTQLRFLGFQHV